MDKDLRIAAWELQVSALHERVAELEAVLLDTSFRAPVEWRLTVSEERVFSALVAREVASKEALLVALYDDTLRDRAEAKIADVFICKLRKKVTRFGVDIQTVWGHGYRLSERETFRRAA